MAGFNYSTYHAREREVSQLFPNVCSYRTNFTVFYFLPGLEYNSRRYFSGNRSLTKAECLSAFRLQELTESVGF